jgi:hypothetical protein
MYGTFCKGMLLFSILFLDGFSFDAGAHMSLFP